MRFLTAGLVWILIIQMVVPPDLNYGHLDVASMMTGGSLTGPLIMVGALGAGAIICLSRLSLAKALILKVNPFFTAFLLLATISILWSADSETTMRRLFRLYAMVSVSLGLMLAGWHPSRFQSVLRSVLTWLLAGSILFGLVYPDLAIEQGAFEGVTQTELVGAWRGLTVQKNTLGAIAATGTIFWLHALLSRQSGVLRAVAGIGVSATCLILSRSSTALLATMFVVLFMILVLKPPTPAFRRYMPYAIGLFTALILVYSLAVLEIVPGLSVLLEPIAAITGKDMSFSGRTDIWAIVKEEIARHPLLGIGYGAYWVGPIPGSPSYQFMSRLYFYPTEAHNGYLDVINDLGFVGGVCLIAYLVAYLRQSLRLMKVDRFQGGLFLSLLFQEFIGNLSEAHWLSVNSVHFFILTLATVALARALVQADREVARQTAQSRQAVPAGRIVRR